MKNSRPSNIITNICLAIVVLFGLFVTAAIINHVFQQSQQNKVEIDDPARWKLSKYSKSKVASTITDRIVTIIAFR